QLLPQPLPLLGLEVDRVDVLVFFGRVLGVLDGAVRPVAEPLGVLLDVRVVGRALEGHIHRYLDAQVAGVGDEGVEVFERAEVGVDGRVPAFGAADAPGAAGFVRPGDGRVVLALAEGDADRVDGRQVEHVEAHTG